MELSTLLFQILFTVFAAVLLTSVGYKMYQTYQLGSYRAREAYKWFKSTRFNYYLRYFALFFLSAIVMGVYVAAFFVFPIAHYFGALAFFGFGILFVVVTLKQKQKTPLKITWRVRRLMIVSFFLNGGLVYGLLRLGYLLPIDFYPFAAFAFLLLPFTVTLAHFITLPIENGIRNRYKRRTMRILDAHEGLIKIGITGSFGKTTVKNILTAMLQKKFKATTTPSSYNTPMGICKAVGDGLGDTEVFVAEMCARYVGDIAELCRIEIGRAHV